VVPESAPAAAVVGMARFRRPACSAVLVSGLVDGFGQVRVIRGQRPEFHAVSVAADHLRSRGSDEGAEAGESAGPGPVPDPHPALVAVEEPSVVQDFEVMADGGLGQIERGGEVANAGLAARAGSDQRHQPEPYGVGERFEQRDDLLGLLLGQRLGG